MDSTKKGRLKDIYIPVIFFSLILGVGVLAAQVGPKYMSVAVVISNNAPIVYNSSVAINGTVTLVDGGTTQFTVVFNVTDADGAANINNAAAGVNITFNGIRRSNNTGNCPIVASSATMRSYSCIVVFYYYDNSTTLWDINLSAADNNGAVASNSSKSLGSDSAAHNVTVNSLSAFRLVNPALVTSANLLDANKELTFVLNNTGNFDFTILNVTPFDLNASLTDFFYLTSNFSINATQSGSGFGQGIQNAVPTNFTDSVSAPPVSATLPHKITSEADTKANRTLYIYIDVPTGLSTGVTYNSSQPWELFAS